MPIDLRVRAGSKNWHKVRATGIGASEIASVLGLSPYASPRVLYHRKRGELPEAFDNSRMDWGRRLERVILQRFKEDHPELSHYTIGRAYRSDRIPWQLATPDATAWSDEFDSTDAIVEIKTGASRDDWGEAGTDEIPIQYRCQVMQSMDVMNARIAYVPVLFNGREYREYVVRYDKAEAHILRTRGAEFWRRVNAGIPPEVDGHHTTSDAMRSLYDVDPTAVCTVDYDTVTKLQRAKALHKRTTEQVALFENRLRVAMGDSSKAYCDGVVVATRSTWERNGVTYKRLNFKGLR